MTPPPPEATGEEGVPRPNRPATEASRVVTRNVVYLFLGQVIIALITFVVTVSVARHLGAGDYGVLFFSASFVSLAFIVVELGQNYYAVSAIARDRSLTAAMFGTGLALRLALAGALYLPVVATAFLLGYPAPTRAAISATFVFLLLNSVASAFSIVFRGTERMDYDAFSQVALKALYGVASLLAVALGAGVVGLIEAQSVGSALGLLVCAALFGRLRVARPRVRLDIVESLVRGGAPFVVWTAIVAVHGALDTLLLSKLVPGEVLGWYAASSRLTQVVILPAGIVASALYPTLSRLHPQAPAAFLRMTRSALKWIFYVGGLAAIGSLLFADEAVALVYGQREFGPAARILEVQSVFVFAVFLDFVLGTALMAANRQKPWIWAKALVVPGLTALNLVLIPACQTRFGNGGIGSAAATASAELVLVIVACVLVPRGALDRGLAVELTRVLAGGLGMILVKRALAGFATLVVMPAAALTYGVVIWVLGGVDTRDLLLLRDAIWSRSNQALPTDS